MMIVSDEVIQMSYNITKDGKWYITWTMQENGDSANSVGAYQVRVRWDGKMWIEDKEFAGKYVGYNYGNNMW